MGLKFTFLPYNWCSLLRRLVRSVGIWWSIVPHGFSILWQLIKMSDSLFLILSQVQAHLIFTIKGKVVESGRLLSYGTKGATPSGWPETIAEHFSLFSTPGNRKQWWQIFWSLRACLQILWRSYLAIEFQALPLGTGFEFLHSPFGRSTSFMPSLGWQNFLVLSGYL